MRVRIKVLRNGQPAAGVALVPNLPLTTVFPLIPAFPRTDVNGECFGVVSLAISPAIYLMDVVVDPEGSAIRISDGSEEIENQFFVDLNRLSVERNRLGDRIPGLSSGQEVVPALYTGAGQTRRVRISLGYEFCRHKFSPVQSQGGINMDNHTDLCGFHFGFSLGAKMV